MAVKVLERSLSTGELGELNLTALLDTLFPIGMTVPWVGGTVPTGYLEFNGQTVSKTTYATLWALWSGLGLANDASTFTLPDYRNVPLAQGSSPGTRVGSDTVDASHSHSNTLAASGNNSTWTTPLTTSGPSTTTPTALVIGSVAAADHTHTVNGGNHNHTLTNVTGGSTTLNIKQREGRISSWIVRAL